MSFLLPEQVETNLKIYRTIETILLFSAIWDPNMLNKMLAYINNSLMKYIRALGFKIKSV